MTEPNQTPTTMTTSATVIFDNGGGITLQLRMTDGGDGTGATYGHHYADAKQAVEDLKAFFDDPLSLHDFEGHEDEAFALVPTDDQIANGGYKVCEYDSAETLIDDQGYDGSWANIQKFEAAVEEIFGEVIYRIRDARGEVMGEYAYYREALVVIGSAREVYDLATIHTERGFLKNDATTNAKTFTTA